MMTRVLIALILFALVASGVIYIVHRRAGIPLRPDVPRRHAVKNHDRSKPGPAPLPAMVADRILIEKSARRLTLFRDGKPIKRYRVALGCDPVGKKTREGDGKTPEGCYIIDYRKDNSRFHRALHISYPNEDDKRQAAEPGVSPGSDIMIHGLKNGMGWIGKRHLMRDWTQGCIAVTNWGIDEIWRLAPVGTKVEIVP
jgi:murein L,D-transpeptidase YafK